MLRTPWASSAGLSSACSGGWSPNASRGKCSTRPASTAAIQRWSDATPDQSAESIRTIGSIASSGELLVQFLHRVHVQVVHVLHALDGSFRAGDGGERGDAGQQRRG